MIWTALAGVIFILIISLWGAKFKYVQTQYGVVRGQLAKDGNYFAFLGIPYASPPLGKNRFKAPTRPRKWTNIYIANETIKCPQSKEKDSKEDCLVLNIFTPIKAINGSLPVLVYIHGGAYFVNYADTRGVEPLIKQNIIVVTPNYRLGAFGFLCLSTEEAPGNAGMKDQVAALKWVQENIYNFGGNPRQVTVYGMSAGGACVELLVLSKTTEGLFRNAIVESGAATTVWAVDRNPITTALAIGEALNFTMKVNNLFNLVEQYQHVPTVNLNKVLDEHYENSLDGTFGFSPCVEKNIYNTTPFLNEPPFEILAKEKYNKVPIIFIFTSLEGLFFKSQYYYEKNYKERMNTNFVDFLPGDLIFDTDKIKKEVSKTIKYFYFGNNTIEDDTIVDYLNYFGDHLVLNCLLNSADIHARHNNPVYLMEFAYKGKLGSYQKFYENLKLAGHGDPKKYALLIKRPKNANDRIMTEKMSSLIANFVKYSNPTPNKTSLLPILWPPVKPGNMRYLYMDKGFAIHKNPYWDRKVFWDKLYAKFRKPFN